MDNNTLLSIGSIISLLIFVFLWFIVRRKLKKYNHLHEQNKRLKQLYLALSQCNQTIIYSADERELFDTVCKNAVQYGGMQMAWIGIADEEKQELSIVTSYGRGIEYLKNLKISIEPEHPTSRGPTGKAYHEHKPYWCQDFQHDPMTIQWHERGKEHGWASSAALPLYRNGKAIGVFSLYSNVLNAFDETTQQLLIEMSLNISYALKNFDQENQRKKAEEEREASYYLIKTIIDSAPVRIFWKDRDLKYLGCNSLFARDANEKSPEEIIGKNDYELTWKEQADLYRQDDLKIIENGVPKLFFEEPQTTPDGKTIWLRTSKVPIFDKDHDIVGVLGMYEDITEHKEAQIALQESQANLEMIFNTEPECVKIVDPIGRLVQMNPAGLAMIEAEDLMTAKMYSLTDFLIPEHRAAFIKLHQKVMNGENGILTFEIVGLKGTHRWLETHATPMKDSNGNITSLLGITRDVTERIYNDNELRKRTQAIEQSPNSIIITDFKANIEYVNTAFCNTSGYSFDEVIGQNPRFLKSGKTPPHAYDEMWEALVNQNKWQGEFINKRKDGSEYVYSINIAPVIDESGKTTHYIAIEEDISKQKETQEKIHYLANFDVLTGLPNRVQLGELLTYTLNLAKRNKTQFAVMFLDLDHFKEINDTLGHHIGDGLLIEISKRLTSVLRQQDTVARMGGDEFVILLPEIDSEGAEEVAKKLLYVIKQPLLVEEHALSITGSVGIAFYPHDGEVIDTLTKNADIAMYRAKQQGRNDYCFFTEGMEIEVSYD